MPSDFLFALRWSRNEPIESLRLSLPNWAYIQYTCFIQIYPSPTAHHARRCETLSLSEMLSLGLFINYSCSQLKLQLRLCPCGALLFLFAFLFALLWLSPLAPSLAARGAVCCRRGVSVLSGAYACRCICPCVCLRWGLLAGMRTCVCALPFGF